MRSTSSSRWSLAALAALVLSLHVAPAEEMTWEERVKLFDYDATAPLDVREAEVVSRGKVRIHDLTYASPKGGRVTAYLVEPDGPAPHAAIVFVHWGQGNRASFLPEALRLARAGAESILIDAPFIRPAPWRVAGGDYAHPEPDRDAAIRIVIDIRRAVDLLLARPEIDPKRIGYVGHSFGATWGGVVAGLEKRVRAYVLMAGLPRLSADLRATRHPILAEAIQGIPAEVLDRYVEVTEPLDAVHFVGRSSPSPILFQWARYDLFISGEQAEAYEKAAGDPKTSRTYDTGHELNSIEALRDRDDWLAWQLDLGDVASLLLKEAGTPSAIATESPAAGADPRRAAVVYRAPGMDQVLVRKDIVYGEAGGSPLKLDLYRPAGSAAGGAPPVVVLIHDDPPSDPPKAAKEWEASTSYGRLLAASGMAAVAFDHRSSEGGLKLYDAARDVDDLIKYLRGHASDLGIDRDRIAVWAFSAATPYGVRAAMDGPPPFVKCIVAYYGPLDLGGFRDKIPKRVLNDTLKMFSPIEYLDGRPEKLPPILVMRADLDLPAINSSIDRFVEEARARGVKVQLLSHPRGHHAFDLQDDDPRSAEILSETMAFVASRLGVK